MSSVSPDGRQGPGAGPSPPPVYAHEIEAAPAAAQGNKSVLRRAWEGYENALSRIVGFGARKYGDLGALTARRPSLVITASLLLGLLACLGFLRFRMETDSNVLWVPRKGQAVDEQNYVKANYPKSQAGASFYAQLAPSQYATYGGNNAVQMSVTWEMFELHNQVMAITVDNDAGQPVTFANLCYKTLNGSCNINSGYLWYWQKSFDAYKQQINATTPTNGNDTAFRQRAGQTVFPDGQPVSLLSVFGGTTMASNPMRVLTAQVIASDYNLDQSVSTSTAKRWNDAFTSLMQAQLPQQQYMTYTWITGSSVGEQLSQAISGDMRLIYASVVLFVVIAIVFLTKPSMVATRTTLALGGAIVAGLGIVSGWGWGLIFGMPFTPLQQLSPFILLGMGIDVIFILVKSYEIIIQRQPWLPLDQAFRKLMSTAGLSVQVTLLASSVAFSLGSTDKLASIEWFSAFATLNTVMIMVLMMTLFVGLMVLTERRIRASRWDCCCCVVSTDAAAAGIAQQQLASASAEGPFKPGSLQAMERPVEAAAMVSDDDVADENLVKKFFRKYYGPALSRWWVKVPIVLVFTAWAVLSWYGVYQTEYGQPLSDLALDGSYLRDYDKVQEATYRQQVGELVSLYYRDIDVSNPLQQYKMLKAWDLALQIEFVDATTSSLLINWMVNFISWVNANDSSAILILPPERNCYNPIISKLSGNLATVNTPTKSYIPGCVRQERFYEMFNKWTNVRGIPANVICANHQLCNAPGARLLTTSFDLMLIPAAGDDKFAAHLIHSMRDLEDGISDSVFAAEDDDAGNYVSFIYGFNWLFHVIDAILPQQALLYFMLALVGVGVVCTFMLVNPVASLLMMVSVGLVVLYLFGELWVLGIRFNQVSVINMIMATGLAVDYSVYFAQKFMTVTADGTGNGRMRAALTDTGSAVFLGGFTALCGTVPMAFAKSVIIRTFFKLIFGTIVFALLTGLVLMPVLFSWIPLPPVKSVLMDAFATAAQDQQQQLAAEPQQFIKSCSTSTSSSGEQAVSKA